MASKPSQLALDIGFTPHDFYDHVNFSWHWGCTPNEVCMYTHRWTGCAGPAAYVVHVFKRIQIHVPKKCALCHVALDPASKDLVGVHGSKVLHNVLHLLTFQTWSKTNPLVPPIPVYPELLAAKHYHRSLFFCQTHGQGHKTYTSRRAATLLAAALCRITSCCWHHPAAACTATPLADLLPSSDVVPCR
jgi:hypothetical protein